MAECTPVLGGILVGVLCVLTLVLLVAVLSRISIRRHRERREEEP